MYSTSAEAYSPEIHRNPLRRLYGQRDFHFVTFSCYHRLPLLSSPSRRNCFVEALDMIRNRHRFLLLGYVVMPEHIHLLVSEPETGILSTPLQVLKQKVSSKLGTNTHSSFWQRRFYDFNVWSSEKLNEKLDYIHNNPIKRKLAAHPGEWPWSSWSNYMQGHGLIPINSTETLSTTIDTSSRS